MQNFAPYVHFTLYDIKRNACYREKWYLIEILHVHPLIVFLYRKMYKGKLIKHVITRIARYLRASCLS